MDSPHRTAPAIRRIARVEDLPYQTLQYLGSGYYSDVFHVEGTETREHYAHKALKPGPIAEVGFEASLITMQREVTTIASLQDHHHFIKLREAYQSRTGLGMIMHPVANGGNLKRYLNDSLNINVIQRAFGCLAQGLLYMHTQGYRHRDIKPDNILVNNGSVLYCDMGLALDFIELHSSITNSVKPDGTGRYAPREWHEGPRRDISADVFSLGCVFLEVLYTLLRRPLPPGDYYRTMPRLTKELRKNRSTLGNLAVIVDLIEGMTQDMPTRRLEMDAVVARIPRDSTFFCETCLSTPPNSRPQSDQTSIPSMNAYYQQDIYTTRQNGRSTGNTKVPRDDSGYGTVYSGSDGIQSCGSSSSVSAEYWIWSPEHNDHYHAEPNFQGGYSYIWAKQHDMGDRAYIGDGHVRR